MVTDVNLLQLRKAYGLIDLTLLGMVTDVNLLQPWKADWPIDVTLLPMIYSFTWDPNQSAIEWSELWDVDTIQLLSKVTDVNPLQLAKASLPIDVTLLGMVTDVNPLQPEKAA